MTGLHANRVSIVIPVFNKRELTEACLDALRRHAPAGVEIVVVDNGSTDGSAAWLRNLHERGEIRAVLNPENLGFARASNQGAAAAGGDLLLFLNNDTEVTEGWLEPLVWTLDHDPYVGAVGSKLLFPDGTVQHAGVALVQGDSPAGPLLGGQHLAYGKPADSPAADKAMVVRCLTAACLLVRREAFEAAGGFDEAYWNGNEDVDLCLKLEEAGWRLVYRPESVVVHHESQSGPERFSKLDRNIALLNARWRDRITPDYYRDLDWKAVAAPDFRLRQYAPPRLRFERDVRKPADAQTASVIVLCHDALEYTQKCAASLLAHTEPRHEIIFVDNGSTDGTAGWLRELTAHQERCHAIYSQENLGYAAGNNLGLAHARGDHLVLLNSDVVVTPGWLERLIAAAQHPQAGVVGPVTNSITGPQKLAQVGYDQESLRDLDFFARMHGDSCRGQDEPALWVVGFCMLIKRDLLARIGGLDERFGRGNFEDTDFCLRAFLAGYQCLIARDCFVHHFGSRSFAAAKVDYRASLEQNWGVFKRKWRIPQAVGYEQKFDLESIVVAGFHPVLHFEPLPRARGVAPIEPTPQDLARRLREGESMFRDGRADDAEAVFRHVLQWRVDEPAAANGLACALWEQGRPDEAAAVLEETLRRDPENEDARWNLAEIRKAIAAASPEPVLS